MQAEKRRKFKVRKANEREIVVGVMEKAVREGLLEIQTYFSKKERGY